mmetsp:Transcript_31197/g.47589  ORF Transcript_31197/g.47589 Transcript_31197/m.47589 type:complete len:239 (+) Transcript_31197:229-945(+)
MSTTNNNQKQESSVSTSKEEERIPTDNTVNNSKRPACSDARDETEGCKQARISKVIEDVAKTLGFKAGDRFEVQWEITDEASGQEHNHWWGATLMDHDGRTSDDGLAIRVLDYDPYPEGGFPDRSLEDVFFANEGILLDHDGKELIYRKEGEEATLSFCEDDLREELNGMLMQVLNKHSAQWQKLDAARQAQLADMMATGKEAIVNAIQNRWDKEKKIISASDIPGILEEAFQNIGTS